MKIRILVLTCLLAAMTNSALFAEWISIKPSKKDNKTQTTESIKTAPQVSVVKQNMNEIVFNVDVFGFDVKSISENGNNYKSIDLLTESTFSKNPGSPELPCIVKNIAVPVGEKITITTSSNESVSNFYNYKIAPQRESFYEGSAVTDLYENNQSYSLNDLYPAKNYEVVNAGIFRDFQIAQVKIYPIRYIPAQNSIEVNSQLSVSIKFENSDSPLLASNKTIHIAPSFAQLYKATIMNYESIIAGSNNVKEDGHDVMLAIVPDAFYNSFLPYAQWKTRAGVQTIITKFSEINANADNPDIIRDYIKKAYEEWEYPPTYVLLVGDYGAFPVKYSVYPDYTLIDEDYFGKVSGDDFFPEIMVGRFPAKETSTLDILVAKAMKYEKTPYMAETDWYKHATVCSNNAYASQPETKRYTRSIMINDGGFTKVDTLMSNGSTEGYGGGCTVDLQDIIDALSEGRSFLNYRGEAWTTGWSTKCYKFQTTDVSDVNNVDKLTFVTNIGCGVNKFDVGGGNCFGEAWLKLGTKTKQRGACAFIGPTSNSHTAYNNQIDKGIYRGLFQEGLTTPAQALLRGKLLMNDVFGSDDHWVKYQFELFCLLGDPSLQIWREVPRYVTLTKPDFLPVGFSQGEFIVKYKDNNQVAKKALVCLSGDGVFETAYTDDNGRVVFSINSTKEIQLNLTVRGIDIYPLLDSISTKNEQIHLYPFGNATVTDPQGNNNNLINPSEKCHIKYLIKNSGSNTANNVSVKLSFENENNANMITTTSVSLGDIAANSDGKSCEFDFSTKNNCTSEMKLPFKMEISSTQEKFVYYLKEKVAACDLTYKSYKIDETVGTKNNRMDPGETVYLYVTAKNIGKDDARKVKATLSCDSSLITIIESVSTCESIATNSDNSAAQFKFKVFADYDIPLNTDIYFKIKFETTNDVYKYSDEDIFELTVSPLNRVDPTGPDGFGYYIYSNTDTLYNQAPKYDWLDISTIGNELTDLTYYQDVCSTVDIPFSFKYYDDDFSNISINNLGWFAFGSSNQTGNQMSKLPNAYAYQRMVAVSWADYLFGWGSQEANIKTYYDQAKHRFIIQWSNLLSYSISENQDYNTFQAILLDPAYYPTQSGNGEIIIQFKKIYVISTNCVGFQNHSGEYGLTYIYNSSFDKTGNILEDGTTLKITTEMPTLIDLSVNEKFINKFDIIVSPNPSTGNSIISISDLAEGNVVIKTYNSAAQLVNTNDYGYHNSGTVNYSWLGNDPAKNTLPNGNYISIVYLNGIPVCQTNIVLSK